MVVAKVTINKISNKIKNKGSSIANFCVSTTDVGIGGLVVRLGKVDLEMSCVEVSSPEVTEIIGVNSGIGIANFVTDYGDLGIICEDVRVDNVGMNSAYSGVETVEISVLTGNFTVNLVTVVGFFGVIRLILFAITKIPALQNKIQQYLLV